MDTTTKQDPFDLNQKSELIELRIPAAMIPQLTHLPKRLKHYAAINIACIFKKGCQPIHSKVASDMVSSRLYGKYLRVMEACPGIYRDTYFLPKAKAAEKGLPAQCKTYRLAFSSGKSMSEHYEYVSGPDLGSSPESRPDLGSSPESRPDLGSSPESRPALGSSPGARPVSVRMASYFVPASFSAELSRCLAKHSHDAQSLVISSEFFSQLLSPSLSYDELSALIPDKEREDWDREAAVDTFWGRYIDCLRRSFDGRFDAVMDSGGRTYHPLTPLAKVLRGRFFMDRFLPENRIIGVDAHALHPWLISVLFSPPDEAVKLQSLFAGGDFYNEFAVLAGVDREDVKVDFLKEVLFSYCPNGRLWNTFCSLFPATAEVIRRVRDLPGDQVSKMKFKKTKQRVFDEKKGEWKFVWKWCKTRIGQSRISKILCRAEGEIFREAQKRLYSSGILTAPLHDALLGRLRDAVAIMDVVKQVMLERYGCSSAIKVEAVIDTGIEPLDACCIGDSEILKAA